MSSGLAVAVTGRSAADGRSAQSNEFVPAATRRGDAKADQLGRAAAASRSTPQPPAPALPTPEDVSANPGRRNGEVDRENLLCAIARWRRAVSLAGRRWAPARLRGGKFAVAVRAGDRGRAQADCEPPAHRADARRSRPAAVAAGAGCQAPAQSVSTTMSRSPATPLPSMSVKLIARVDGYLEKLHYQDGAFVKKGDLLFTIQQDQYKDAAAAGAGAGSGGAGGARLRQDRAGPLHGAGQEGRGDPDRGRPMGLRAASAEAKLLERQGPGRAGQAESRLYRSPGAVRRHCRQAPDRSRQCRRRRRPAERRWPKSPSSTRSTWSPI